LEALLVWLHVVVTKFSIFQIYVFCLQLEVHDMACTPFFDKAGSLEGSHAQKCY